MPEVRKTLQFDRCLKGLRDTQARARILKRIVRLGNGNPGVVEPVGEHVSEIKIDVGPGYRLYFIEPVKGRIVILLCGGDKDSQHRDIATAKRIAKFMAKTIAEPI